MPQSAVAPVSPAGIEIPPGVDELVTSDGEPMESERHVKQMYLLVDLLRGSLAGRSDVYVGCNMFLYFSALQARKNDFRGPDVFVVLGTPDRERKAWVMWEEDGKSPDVIFELVSESTEGVDRGRKMQVYAGLGVHEYFLFDPFSGRLDGFRLPPGGGGYAPIEPGPSDRLPSESLGVHVGVWDGNHHGRPGPWLRCFDPSGALVPSPDERADEAQARADAEQARADAERARADAERARADRLEAELAALRARTGSD